MTLASVAQKVISFLYFTFIARLVGAEDTGKYFLALAFTTLFAVLTDFGLSPALNREVARKPGEAQKILGSVLSLKIAFMVVTYALMMIASWMLGYDSEMRLLIALSGITMIFDSIHLSLYAVLRGLHKLKYEAFAIVLSQLSTLIIGTIALLLHQPLMWLIIAFIISSFLNVLYATTTLWRVAHVKIELAWQKSFIKPMLIVALPFALAGLFARVYSYSDSIFVKHFLGDAAVGWYSIPNKITFAFQFIPLALTAALYPRMSEAFVTDKARLAYLFEMAMKYVTVAAFPIAIGIGLLSREFILAVYTAEYAASIVPLQILLASLIFAFLDFPIGSVLNGCNRQSVQTAMMGIAMVVNIFANMLFIPSYGIAGAAVAAFVGNFVLMAGGYLFLPRVIYISHARIFGMILRAAFAAAVMGVAVVLLKYIMPWYATIPFAITLYGAGLFVVKLVSFKDIRELKNRLSHP